METKILIAEDEPYLRRSFAAFFKKRGYFPIEAENGYDALQQFRREKPDLILTDLRMPVMDGFDLLEEVVMESPETPIIIFSGVGDKADIITALRSGAWDYITKPIEDFELLIERVEKALIQAQMAYGYTATMENVLKKRNETLKKELEEKKKLERMIFQVKREWERTVDSLTEMLALFDCNHRLIRINKAMAAYLGKVQAEVAGRIYYLSSQGFDDQEQAEYDIQRLLHEGQSLTGTCRDEERNALYEINLTPYFDDDDRTVIGGVFIARDITNR